MSNPPVLDDQLPDAVEHVLEVAQKHDRSVDKAAGADFAFNVLLNALATVLEEIRARDPERYLRYQEFALLTLRDTDEEPRMPVL